MEGKMDIPKVKRFSRGDRLYVQAQQIWIILVAFVMHSKRDPKAPDTITYGELAEKMGRPDRRAGITLARQLGIVGELCKANDLPTLNAIVVNQDSGMPGDHVVLRDHHTPKQEQADVMRQDWFQLRVPTAGTFRKVWRALQDM
jgi:hypothetical protein